MVKVSSISRRQENDLFGSVKALWMPFLVIGLGIVIFALIFGIYNSLIVSDYLSNAKITREAAGTGSILAQQRSFIESTIAWLPPLAFLGLGLIISSMVIILANILHNLDDSSLRLWDIFSTKGSSSQSTSERLFPWIAVAGLTFLIIAFIVGIYQATLTASYWNNSIIAELDPAPADSVFASQLMTVETLRAFLDPLRFLGLAAVLASAVLGALAIHRALRTETLALINIAESKRRKAAA